MHNTPGISFLPRGATHRELGLFPGTKPLGKKPLRGRTSSYPGIFASTKCLGEAIFESLLERDSHTLLCTDPRVKAYAMQAHRLEYWTPLPDGTGKRRSYTPDFVVLLKTGQVLIVEVKAEAFTKEKYWIEREPYIREAYAREHALEFRVLTERHIRVQPRLSNLQRMLRFGGRIQDPAADLAVRQALRLLGDRPRIGQVCDAAVLRENREPRCYSAIMRMALRGEVSLDLDVPFSPATAILRKPADD